MGKRIGVMIKSSPYRSFRSSEALRMAVGMTLVHQDVWLILLDQAVEALRDCDGDWEQAGDFRRHVYTFYQLGLPVVVEEEAFRERGMTPPFPEILIWSRREIFDFTPELDVTLLVGG